MISERENFLRMLNFRTPEWIPCGVGFSLRTWHKYRERLEAVVLRHQRVISSFPEWLRLPTREQWDRFPAAYREHERFRDNWGCVWYNTLGGLEGQVVESPLSDWSALDSYRPPDWRTLNEREPMEWDKYRRDLEERRLNGKVVVGDGGRLFDRLYLLRGFENLMLDFATDDPHLPKLIDLLLQHTLAWIKPSLEFGVDVMAFHTDIGTQKGLMISPAMFRKYVKPMFREVFQTCRRAGVHVYLSSDGRLLEIVDDLIECGVSIHDPQLRANTLDGIEKYYKGRLCINLDLDRQMFAFCRPDDIRRQVKECVERLYTPEGGLMLIGAVWDDLTPLENIEALCEALEEHCLNICVPSKRASN
jgi:uroporphyrinogen decarboxylase